MPNETPSLCYKELVFIIRDNNIFFLMKIIKFLYKENQLVAQIFLICLLRFATCFG